MPVYTNNNPLKYTKITFNEEMDVTFVLHGAGGGGGGHPDDVNKDYRGGNGGAGDKISGTVRVQAGDVWTAYIGGGGRRGLSWYIGGHGGPGGSSKSGYHGGAGGAQGAVGKSAGGAGGGGASIISINGSDRIVAAGGGGGGGEGQFSSGGDSANHVPGGTFYGSPGQSSNVNDGGGGGGGGGGSPGGVGGSFGSGDVGGKGGSKGQSSTISGANITVGAGSAGGIGGSGDFTNNTDGADGYFEITSFVLPTSRYRGIYTKNAGTWKQPTPSVKHNGVWKQIQEGYVKHNGQWKRVYPPKVSVEIEDYNVTENIAGTAVPWDSRVVLLPSDPVDPPPPPPDETPNKFAFVDVVNAQRSTEQTSNSVTITGIDVAVAVSATNGALVSIGGGPFTTSGMLTNGSTLRVKMPSAANYNTGVFTIVTVGKTSATWNITTGEAPIPTYGIYPSATSIKEAETIVYTVTTTNVADGTVLNWEATGKITAADFTDQKLTGTVTISNNTGLISRTLKSKDGNANPNDYIIMKLKNSQGTSILATATSVEVIDVPEDTITYPTSGTLISTYCKGFDKWGVYANGTGGTTERLIAANSADCGWTDTDPDPFSFTAVSNAELSTTYTATATITGITTSVSVTSNGELSFSKNGGAFSKSLTVSNGDRLTISGLSDAYYSRIKDFSITVGTRSASWSISTKAGPKPVARATSWSGPFNAVNASISIPLEANATNASLRPFTSARIVTQPKNGTVTLSGTTAIYKPNTGAQYPSALSDAQAQTYVDYWTDLYPNGIKSTAAAKNHWAVTGIGEQRYIPAIFTGSDSFTWAITNEFGESNVVSCTLTFSAPVRNILDDQGPSVASVTPSSGATGVSSSIAINVAYDDEIYPGTGSITMTGSDGSSAAWTNSTASRSGRIVSFSPAKLKSSTTYTVSVPAGFVKDLAGNNSNAYSWSFSTADTEGPYVIRAEWMSDGWIRITWNEPVTNVGGYASVLGPWYYDGALEDVESEHLPGDTPTTTKIRHRTWGYWRGERYGINDPKTGYWYWSHRSYSLTLDEGAVTDLSGNPSRIYHGGYETGYVSGSDPRTNLGTFSSTVPVTTTTTAVTPVETPEPEQVTPVINVVDSSYTSVINWNQIAQIPTIVGNIDYLRIIGGSTDQVVSGASTTVVTQDKSVSVSVPVVPEPDPTSTATNIIGQTSSLIPQNQFTVSINPAPNGALELSAESQVAVSNKAATVQTGFVNLSLELGFTGGYTATHDLQIPIVPIIPSSAGISTTGNFGFGLTGLSMDPGLDSSDFR